MQIDMLISNVATFVWGPWLIALLFGTHLYLTFRTGFMLASRLGQTNQAKEAYQKAILRGGPAVPLQDKIKIQRVNP